MFSSPNTTGYGTLGSSTPSQNLYGLPNVTANNGPGVGNGATSSPAFFSNTPGAQGTTQAPLANYNNIGGMAGTPGLQMGSTPGMLSVPPGLGMGSYRPTGTPSGLSISGQSQTQGKVQGDGGGISIEMALKGLEEAMAAVQKMEELLMSIKTDRGMVFGDRSKLSGGTEAQQPSEGDGNAEGGRSEAGAIDQIMAGDEEAGGTLVDDGTVIQRLQQTQSEYTQLFAALQQHLFTTNLGALPLQPFTQPDRPPQPPSAEQLGEPAPDQDTVQASVASQQPMGMQELTAWAEKRAELEFARREGVKNGAKAVLDALKMRLSASPNHSKERWQRRVLTAAQHLEAAEHTATASVNRWLDDKDEGRYTAGMGGGAPDDSSDLVSIPDTEAPHSRAAPLLNPSQPGSTVDDARSETYSLDDTEPERNWETPDKAEDGTKSSIVCYAPQLLFHDPESKLPTYGVRTQTEVASSLPWLLDLGKVVHVQLKAGVYQTEASAQGQAAALSSAIRGLSHGKYSATLYKRPGETEHKPGQDSDIKDMIRRAAGPLSDSDAKHCFGWRPLEADNATPPSPPSPSDGSHAAPLDAASTQGDHNQEPLEPSAAVLSDHYIQSSPQIIAKLPLEFGVTVLGDGKTCPSVQAVHFGHGMEQTAPGVFQVKSDLQEVIRRPVQHSTHECA